MTASAPARRRFINNRRDLLVFILVFLAVSLVVAVASFVLWASNPAQPRALALAALEDSATVDVTIADGLISFEPLSVERRPLGVVFLPGGLVDPRAYAPILRPLAEAGYVTVTMNVTLNLAILDGNSADRARAAFPEISQWAVGGHSLGGATAGAYALAKGDLEAIFFLGAFPNGDMSSTPLPSASIYGDLDGLRPLDEVENSRAVMPPGTEYVLVAGGNHAGFGDYGDQAGDLPATIPLEQQHAETVAAILALLEQVPGA